MIGTAGQQIGNGISESLEVDDPILKRQILEELKNGYRMEMVRSGIHKKIAQENAVTNKRSIDGVGRLRMSVDATHFHFYGQKYGYACWGDNGFLKDVEKVHPELKVKCGGTRIQSGYSRPDPKFSKAYNL